MSKFNHTGTRPAVASPIVAEAAPSGVTREGGAGYARDARSELFLLAVSNMVGEATFYESSQDRDSRFATLVGQVAVADPVWTGDFLRWLRAEGNMRSASLVGAAEFVHARLASGADQPLPRHDHTTEGTDSLSYSTGSNRRVVADVLQRADEPGEFLAYWTSRYGRAIPKPVKRGVADAVRRLYTEFSLLKYDTASHGFRFADVLDLTHPDPVAPWQGDLFRYALDRRHGHDEAVPAALSTVAANGQLRATAAADPTVLLDADALKAAGMTWEDALSLAGSRVDKQALWTALIPSMGYMALLRNLRNFDEVGVSDEVAATVAARLSDSDQVAKSRQLPMRFLSAYKATANLRWAHALDKALTASLANVPALAGRTLILVDLSGSMGGPLSAKSDLTRAEAATIFGSALAMRTDPTLVAYDNSSQRVDVPRGGSLLPLVRAFPRMGGGTSTGATLARWFDGHDRVVIVTDEQAHDNVNGAIPAHVPLYTWNLAGYRMGHTPSGLGTRHTFGGLTDAAFRMIPLLEAGRNATWPWL
jgi:hypothetical protein